MTSETNENKIKEFKNHVSSAMVTFTIFTTIFILMKIILVYFMANKDSIRNIQMLFSFGFVVLFFLFSFFTNLSVTKNELICGKSNFKIAIYATIVPFIFIFTIGVLLISVFPGWIRCFSNTFGTSILNIMFSSENEIRNKLLNTNNRESSANNNTNISETTQEKIDTLYNLFEANPKIILNELEMDKDGNVIMDPLKHIISTSINHDDDIQKMLKQYIYSKQSIGQGIWYYLLGIITILMSYNTILSENCNAFKADKDKFRKYISDKYQKN